MTPAIQTAMDAAAKEQRRTDQQEKRERELRMARHQQRGTAPLKAITETKQLPCLSLRMEARTGADLYDLALHSISIASRNSCSVVFTYETVECYAVPGANIDEFVAKIRAAMRATYNPRSAWS